MNERIARFPRPVAVAMAEIPMKGFVDGSKLAEARTKVSTIDPVLLCCADVAKKEAGCTKTISGG